MELLAGFQTRPKSLFWFWNEIFYVSNPSLYILPISQSSSDIGAVSWHLLCPLVPSAPMPSLWRLGTFFPTSGCIVVASPHVVTRVTSKRQAPPQLQPVRTRALLQFVIIIKGLTPEASLPLFTPPTTTLTTPLVPHGWAWLKAMLVTWSLLGHPEGESRESRMAKPSQWGKALLFDPFFCAVVHLLSVPFRLYL